MRARFAVGLALSTFVYAACGGRLVESGSSEDGGSTGNGASPNIGATSSRGGRSAGGTSAGGRIGVSGSSSSSGGAVAVAGTSSIGTCACPPIHCALGYELVPNGDGCCFHCEPVCRSVACPSIACRPGSYQELLPDQCCPTCTPEPCELQRKKYQAVRQQLIEKYSALPCMTNADCSMFYEKNQCAVGCGIPMPSAALGDLSSNLQTYAQGNCSPECAGPVPPCDPSPAPACVQGRCQ